MTSRNLSIIPLIKIIITSSLLIIQNFKPSKSNLNFALFYKPTKWECQCQQI